LVAFLCQKDRRQFLSESGVKWMDGRAKRWSDNATEPSIGGEWEGSRSTPIIASYDYAAPVTEGGDVGDKFLPIQASRGW
jgi:hypothetical protein